MWCYTSFKQGNPLQTIFSIPFWIAGIYIVKKKLFKPKEEINNEKPKTKTKLNIDFRILISALLVIVALLSGIAMLFFGIKDTTIKGFSYSLSYDSDYEIIDTSKEIENFACDQQLEEIFEDANYIYYLPCIKSQYIEVRYSNGTKENIIAALGQGHIDIGVLDKFNIEYIKKEKTMMWKLENDQEVIKNVNSNVIKEELSKADNLEIAYLTLTPPKNIKDTRFIQTYNDINVGNPKNENEKFHIEICVNDKEKEFKLMAKDNLTKEEIEKIFIDYFENNIVPDISEWYEL